LKERGQRNESSTAAARIICVEVAVRNIRLVAQQRIVGGQRTGSEGGQMKGGQRKDRGREDRGREGRGREDRRRTENREGSKNRRS